MEYHLFREIIYSMNKLWDQKLLQYLCGPYNNTNGNLYFLNVTSTSIQVPLGQISINMYNGSILVYSGTLAPHTFKNVTISSDLSNFAAGSDIMISVSGQNKIITSVSLIYASSVFAIVNPTWVYEWNTKNPHTFLYWKSSVQIWTSNDDGKRCTCRIR